MRAYFFGNFYLSSIQQGIQAAHVTHELFLKYVTPQGSVSSDAVFVQLKATAPLLEWAASHKTMILLNGGDQDGLEYIYGRLEELTSVLHLPFAKFHESKGALNGALTSMGIIVPQHIYEMLPEEYSEARISELHNNPQDMRVQIAEAQLAALIKTYGLAK